MATNDDTSVTLTYKAKDPSQYALDRSIDQCQVTVGVNGTDLSTVTLWWYSMSPNVTYDELQTIDTYYGTNDRYVLANYMNMFPASMLETGPAFDVKLSAGNNIK
jgi:hypothetical protein